MKPALITILLLLFPTVAGLSISPSGEPVYEPRAPGKNEGLVPVLLSAEMAGQLQLPLPRQQPGPFLLEQQWAQIINQSSFKIFQVEKKNPTAGRDGIILHLKDSPRHGSLSQVSSLGGELGEDLEYLVFVNALEMIDNQTARMSPYPGFPDVHFTPYPVFNIKSVSHLTAAEEAPSRDVFLRPLSEPPEVQVLLLRPAPPEPEPRIALYAGTGSWEEGNEATASFLEAHGFRWAEINEAELQSGRLDRNFDAVWFGGGFSEEYRYYVQDHAAIQSFVEKGGVFIGICAGAYYAADIMVWEEAVHDYPFGLFKGKAIWPFSDNTHWSSRTDIILNHELDLYHGYPEAVEMYHLDGPYFEPAADQPVSVLARYRLNGKPAALSFQYGDGKVLLIGSHPELGVKSWDPFVPDLHGNSGAQWPWLKSTLDWVLRQPAPDRAS